MTIIANIGALALYLLFIWLGSAIAASYLSNRKGWGEQPGLASGLLLTVLGPLAWLVVPRRPPTLAPGAAAALVFSVASGFLSPLAPFALRYARRIDAEIVASDGVLTGALLTLIARVVAVFGIVFLVAEVLLFLALRS
ncbi:MAG: hypothetical protein QOE11_967 [Solirubrobacteraceae bacterium]|nr:hypothetical protein [Solirubrobacteraceae bacterium]